MKTSITIQILMFLISRGLFAESSGNVYSYVANGGAVSVSAGGAVVLPYYVYQGLDQGQLNPLLQLSLQQHIMNQCVEKALQAKPGTKTAYATAKGQFDLAICQLSKCYQQMMMLDYLSQSSPNASANGGQTDSTSQQTSQSVAAMLYKSIGDSSCQSGSSSVDPNLAHMLGK